MEEAGEGDDDDDVEAGESRRLLDASVVAQLAGAGVALAQATTPIDQQE